MQSCSSEGYSNTRYLRNRLYFASSQVGFQLHEEILVVLHKLKMEGDKNPTAMLTEHLHFLGFLQSEAWLSISIWRVHSVTMAAGCNKLYTQWLSIKIEPSIGITCIKSTVDAHRESILFLQFVRLILKRLHSPTLSAELTIIVLTSLCVLVRNLFNIYIWVIMFDVPSCSPIDSCQGKSSSVIVCREVRNWIGTIPVNTTYLPQVQ